MTGFLASVANGDEMELAREAGADIVDLKDPNKGALGAWSLPMLRGAVARWQGWSGSRLTLSATVGDHPMDADVLLPAVREVAATGIPIVKIGLFTEDDDHACIEALRSLAHQARLVAVFFADRFPDFDLIEKLSEADFYGAMIDTADKGGGGLRKHLPDSSLKDFVTRARRSGLVTGLAGSLTPHDIEPLAAARPDYLGFRGALCRGGRSNALDLAGAKEIRRLIDLNTSGEDEKLPLPSGIEIADETARAV